MRNAFMGAVFDACKSRDDIMILSGDTGAGLFDNFKKQYPDRFLNMGIAEQNMASFAAGLAMTGKKVVIYNIIPFLLYRCYEQVRNDICYQGLPVVLVGVGSGLTYAPQGMTHYAVEDLGLCQTLPNLTVISPGDAVEAKFAAQYVLECGTPSYVRMAKVGGPELYPPATGSLDITLPSIVRHGSNIAILFHGSVSSEVLAAWESLENKPLLVSVPVVQPLDFAELHGILYNPSFKIRKTLVVEEHYKNCGLCSVLKQWNEEYEYQYETIGMGVTPEFIHEIKDLAGMREHYGISARKIADEVRKAWN